MKEFLLLFRGGEDMSPSAQTTPERLQQQMMKWKTWMEGLGKQGILIGGQPLAQTGSVIKGNKKVVTDGPFIEGKEMVGGYLMIKAKSLPEAVEISKNCPIFESNGIVEVREAHELRI